MLKRHLVFGSSIVALLAANVRLIGELVELGGNDPTASHHVLVPFVTAVLIFGSRQEIFAVAGSDRLAGAALGLAGLMMAWAGAGSGPSNAPGSLGLTVRVGAIAVLWMAAFLMCYGRQAFRAALFPLLFLAFMVPMPAPVVETVTSFLKSGSSDAVAGLFTLTGTPYHREGFVFSLPSAVIEVADECSGIRSSIALLLTSLLAGHMFLQSGWKKALLAAVVVPLAILKNGIRIVTLSLLAMHVDPGFLTGALHHEGGYVFFLVTLAILAPLFIALYRSDFRRGAEALRS